MRFVPLIALLVVGTAGGLSGQDESVFDHPDRVWIIDDIRVPAVADTFALLEVQRWPRLEMGFSLRYRTPISDGVELNLYVFPVPPERRAQSLDDEIM